MKFVLKDKNIFVLRFDKGEEMITELRKFCVKQKIGAAVFSGIGAARNVELAHYDIDTKKYSEKTIPEKTEINGLAGTVALMKKEIVIHCHGVFSNSQMRVWGGHVKRLIISATGEIVLEKFTGKIERKFSPEIGLNLMR